MRQTRREMLRSTAFGTIGLFWAQTLAGAGVMFWPIKIQGFGGVVPAPVKLSDLKPGDKPVKVREGKCYLVRLPEGLMALYWRCPHLGCTVPWSDSEGQFHCPCHSSTYQPTGQNIAGPTPRPMDYMELTVKDDLILIDTAKIHVRTEHLPEHVFPV